MDTSDPEITFDSDGRSNHYWYFQERQVPRWPYLSSNGTTQLWDRVDEIKRRGRHQEYDSILGLSGGLDSSYMLHVVVTQLGLRPLVFHVDGGWNTDIAIHNISALVEKLNLDLYTKVIDWESMRRFQLALFRSGVPHLDIPQDLAFISALYEFAQQHGITTILNGGNVATESVLMPVRFLYWGTDITHIRDVLRSHHSWPLPEYPMSSVWRHKVWLRYFKRVSVFKPLNYVPFEKRAAERLLEETYGWRAYPQKHFESRFTRFFEGYWLPERFGYDMRKNQLSSLILSNQITRKEALEILDHPPLEPSVAQQEMRYVSDKLEVPESELQSLFEMPHRYYWDYKNRHKLLSAGEWFMSRVTGTRRGGAL